MIPYLAKAVRLRYDSYPGTVQNGLGWIAGVARGAGCCTTYRTTIRSPCLLASLLSLSE